MQEWINKQNRYHGDDRICKLDIFRIDRAFAHCGANHTNAAASGIVGYIGKHHIQVILKRFQFALGNVVHALLVGVPIIDGSEKRDGCKDRRRKRQYDTEKGTIVASAVNCCGFFQFVRETGKIRAQHDQIKRIDHIGHDINPNRVEQL